MLTSKTFLERCLIVLALVAAAALLFSLAKLFLLIFAAIVLAAILVSVQALITRLTGLRGALAFTAAVLTVFVLLAGVFLLFGAQIGGEIDTIRQRLPEAIKAVQAQLDRWGIGQSLRNVLDQALGDASSLLSSAGGYVLTLGSGLSDFVLILFGGIFIAAQPDLYRKGVLMLVPKQGEKLAAEAMDKAGEALSLWLRGQLLSMLGVTIFTGIGLWLLGVPAALGLGLIAGLLDFIPFIGPIIAAVPAVLLAFTLGPALALWTVGLYFVGQQIQGNILQPLVQKHAVDIAPAVLLFSVGAAGLLFGILGVILAAPLTVVCYVLVQRLYVQAALGKLRD